MINKKTLAIILAALNLMLLGCAYDSAEAPGADNVSAQSEPLNTTGALSLSGLNEMLLYENSQYGIGLSYPADWIAQEYDPNDAGIIVGFMAPEENIDDPTVYLLVQNEELPAGEVVTIEQYSQAALRILNESLPDLEVLKESNITIGELPGYAIVYKLERENMTVRVLNAWTVVGEDAYVFTYNAPDELYDQFAADAADMIDSFNAVASVQDVQSAGAWEEEAATATLDESKSNEEENTSITY